MSLLAVSVGMTHIGATGETGKLQGKNTLPANH